MRESVQQIRWQCVANSIIQVRDHADIATYRKELRPKSARSRFVCSIGVSIRRVCLLTFRMRMGWRSVVMIRIWQRNADQMMRSARIETDVVAAQLFLRLPPVTTIGDRAPIFTVGA